MKSETQSGDPNGSGLNVSNEVQGVPHIVFSPPERTPLENRIVEVTNNALRLLRENLSGAKSLKEFMHHYYALRLFYRESIDWMWDTGDPNQNDVAKFFYSDNLKNRVNKDVSAVEELAPKVRTMEDSPDHIKIALKRIRGRHAYYEYGVLAQFPRGIQANQPILGYTDLEETRTNPDTIFFHPTTPCVQHASDDLFKMNRGNGLYIPYRNRRDALRSLQENDSGLNEYQLLKTPENVVKQEINNYILVGLQSGYSNESFVVPVSRFAGFKRR